MEAVRINVIVVLIAVITLVSGIGVLISSITQFMRQVASSERDGKQSGIICAGLLLIFCGILSLICLILNGSSTSAILVGLTTFSGQVDKSANSVSTFAKDLGSQIDCIFKVKKEEIQNFIENSTVDIQKVIDRIQLSLDKEERVRNEMGELSRNTESFVDPLSNNDASLLKLDEYFNILPNLDSSILDVVQLRKGLSEIETNLKVFRLQGKVIDQEFETVRENMFGEVFNEVSNFTINFASMTRQFMKDTNFKLYAIYALFTSIMIPVISLLMCLIALAILLIRCICNCFTKSSKSGERSIFSKTAAFILDIAGYTSMLTSGLLFLATTMVFLVAFAAILVCVGFFEDPEIRVFRVIESSVVTQKQWNISISNIFYKCKNGYSFFDAMDGSKLITDAGLDENIKPMLIRGGRRTIEKSIFANGFPTMFHVFLKNGDSLFNDGLGNVPVKQQKMKQNYTKFKAYVQQVVDLEMMVYKDAGYLSSRNITYYVMDVNNKLSEAIRNMMITLVDMSSRCHALMAIWDDLGWFICHLMALPLSGIWFACCECF
ncbi:hypothetical protein DICVIV_14112 [Dictyocaulus viviparus]|uniref:Prominin n=1 Tax=Dictyocaulus viviparus TaxID=29172 RepID=A0A0D8X654_DICVI|nr:hypothetical protein DICVIV_14112 [Dictyocaulus viviparus]